MFTKAVLVGSTIQIHADAIDRSIPKKFSNGTFIFNSKTGTMSIAGEVLHIQRLTQRALKLEAGIKMRFVLFGPDGQRPQVREEFLPSKNEEGLFVVPGCTSRPMCPACARNNVASELKKKELNSGDEVKFCPVCGFEKKFLTFPFRVYPHHTGIETDRDFPQLAASALRQWQYWVELVRRCQEARKNCSDIPEEVIRKMAATILRELDVFNDSLGRSKNKIKHPKALKTEQETIGATALWSMAGKLKKRREAGKPNPDGLEDRLVTWIKGQKQDFEPINEFRKNFRTMANGLAETMKLAVWEKEPVVGAFQKQLQLQKNGMAQHELTFDEGWPKIRPFDPSSFGIYYYLRAGGKSAIKATRVQDGTITSIKFGLPVPTNASSHPQMVGRRSKRPLRPLEIDINHPHFGRLTLHLAVLQSRDIPEDANIKEWRLVSEGGVMFIHLVLEPTVNSILKSDKRHVSAIDPGYRRMGDNVRVAVVCGDDGSERELVLPIGSEWPICDPDGGGDWPHVHSGLTGDKTGTKSGSNHAGRRTGIEFSWREQERLQTKIGVLLEESKIVAVLSISDPKTDIATHITRMRQLRATVTANPDDNVWETLKDIAKNAGIVLEDWRKLRQGGLKAKINELEAADAGKSLKSVRGGTPSTQSERRKPLGKNSGLLRFLLQWKTDDERINRLQNRIRQSIEGRRERLYYEYAHQICCHASRIIWKNLDLKGLAEQGSEGYQTGEEALKESQKFRGWASLFKLGNIIKQVAAKYGMTESNGGFVLADATHTTSECHVCGKTADVKTGVRATCPAGHEWDIDVNACRNLLKQKTKKAVSGAD